MWLVEDTQRKWVVKILQPWLNTNRIQNFGWFQIELFCEGICLLQGCGRISLKPSLQPHLEKTIRKRMEVPFYRYLDWHHSILNLQDQIV